MDLGIPTERRARLRHRERRRALLVQPRGVDLLASWEVSGELAQSLAQLARCPDGIPALIVVKRDGEVNQRLQEQAARSAFVRPDLFEYFMADEELAAVEEVDTVLEARVQPPG